MISFNDNLGSTDIICTYLLISEILAMSLSPNGGDMNQSLSPWHLT